MKTQAARIHQYGGPEVVRVEECMLPDPQPDEITVRVHAAGVNPIDWKLRVGDMKEMIPLTLPFTLGGDFSGVVEKVGAAVKGLSAGDEVYGHGSVVHQGSGSFARFVTAKAGTVAAKPRKLGHVEAAALPLVGVSALQAVVEHLGVEQEENVLIHGGAGGIGSMAMQIARDRGAHVNATAAAADAEFVAELGAQKVIDYKRQRFDEMLHDLDAVLDTVGGDTYVRSYGVLKRGGRLVSMLERPREDLMRDYDVLAIYQLTQVTTERLAQLAELVDEGAVKVHVGKTFPLEQAAEALRTQEQASLRGKIVLTIA